MAGTFILGETKVRPGAYFNIQKKDKGNDDVIMEGVTAVIFRADFGPLGTAVELDIGGGDDYSQIYGTGLTTDAVREAAAGGAKTVIACRLGSGGVKEAVTLAAADGGEALTVSAKYAGEKGFAVTIRGKLSDPTVKECIFYAGTGEFEKVEFASGEGEAKALADALAYSRNFTAELKEGMGGAELGAVSQSTFTKGENPQVTVKDYSDAFALVEPYEFNTICVDTEDPAVHMLLQSFVRRIFDAGSLAQAVVAEKHTVRLEERVAHAAAFNDEKMNYVLNAHINEQGTEIDGYQTAARIAGMIGAAASNTSLTHTVVSGFTEILERLSNTEIIAAEKKGCIVLSYNKKSKRVWVDSAVNTLTVPAENQDDGWKKIRRVKTRFELMRRINNAADAMVGKIDNDTNGRATITGKLQAVGDSMREEGKLVACTVTEDSAYVADGDSAWFLIDVIDKDSTEHIYMTYLFQFSTIEG